MRDFLRLFRFQNGRFITLFWRFVSTSDNTDCHFMINSLVASVVHRTFVCPLYCALSAGNVRWDPTNNQLKEMAAILINNRAWSERKRFSQAPQITCFTNWDTMQLWRLSFARILEKHFAKAIAHFFRACIASSKNLGGCRILVSYAKSRLRLRFAQLSRILQNPCVFRWGYVPARKSALLIKE